MKTSLEYNQLPATLHNLETGKVLVRAQFIDGIIRTVHPTVVITICAHCDPDKTTAQTLIRAGYKINHGICEKHKQEWFKAINHN